MSAIIRQSMLYTNVDYVIVLHYEQFRINLYIPLITSLDARNTLIKKKKGFANSVPRMLCLNLKYFITKCSKKVQATPPPP
jgi:hypothetical protein